MKHLIAINENDTQRLQEQIALGDERAFRQLFDHFAEKLFCFAFAIIKTKDGATEVVDEVFVKIWKQRTTIARIGYLKTYLYTSVKNASLNYLSRKATETNNRVF